MKVEFKIHEYVGRAAEVTWWVEQRRGEKLLTKRDGGNFGKFACEIYFISKQGDSCSVFDVRYSRCFCFLCRSLPAVGRRHEVWGLIMNWDVRFVHSSEYWQINIDICLMTSSGTEKFAARITSWQCQYAAPNQLNDTLDVISSLIN